MQALQVTEVFGLFILFLVRFALSSFLGKQANVMCSNPGGLEIKTSFTLFTEINRFVSEIIVDADTFECTRREIANGDLTHSRKKGNLDCSANDFG